MSLCVGWLALTGLPAFLPLADAEVSQAGALDTRFHVGAGASDDVLTAARLPDGGWLLGGYFTAFDGQERWRLARLRADGTLDPDFDPGDSSGSAPITQLAALPDGKVLVAGTFTHFGGTAHSLVARLLPTGKVDPTFNAGAAFAGVQGRVQTLTVLPGGKLLLGGRFDASVGARRKGSAFLVRLLADGGLDPDFTCELVPQSREDEVEALTILADGTILVGTHTGVFRLQANGKPDKSFHPPATAGVPVSALGTTPDHKLLVALAGQPEGWQVQRWELDGKADPTFQPIVTKGEEAGALRVFALEPGGKILVGGSFHLIGDQRRHGLARLTDEGALDPTFDPGTGTEVIPFDEADETPEATVRVLLPLAEGGLFVAGRFDLYNGAISHNVARVWDPLSASPLTSGEEGHSAPASTSPPPK